MDPKKALMKGLKSISREEFIETARFFAEEEARNHKDFDKDKQLRQKYPVYDEVFQIVSKAAQTKEELPLLMHASGMVSALRVLLHIAEGK